MNKPAKLFREKLAVALEPHGAIGEFCRKTGFSRSAVENWRDGTKVPGIDKVEAIASALGTTPAALLSDTSESVAKEAEKPASDLELKILEAARMAAKEAIRAQQPGNISSLSPVRRRIIEMIIQSPLDDIQLESFFDAIGGELAGGAEESDKKNRSS